MSAFRKSTERAHLAIEFIHVPDARSLLLTVTTLDLDEYGAHRALANQKGTMDYPRETQENDLWRFKP